MAKGILSRVSVAKGILSRVCILFISAAVAEGGIYVSGLFIMVVLRGNTPYSLYINESDGDVFLTNQRAFLQHYPVQDTRPT